MGLGSINLNSGLWGEKEQIAFIFGLLCVHFCLSALSWLWAVLWYPCAALSLVFWQPVTARTPEWCS